MIRLLSAALVLLSLACEEPPPPPEPTETSQEVFLRLCRGYAAAYCARRDRCAVDRDRALQGDACVQALEAGCSAAQNVAPGKTFEAFEADQAQVCVAALSTAECALFDERIIDFSACRTAFGSGAANGGACLVNGDCATGYCARVGDGCGQCEPRAAVAESCADFACEADAVCVRDVCRPRRPEAHACEQDTECGPGLFCHLSNRVCEAQRGEDAPCADDRGIRDCAEHLFCADRVCTAPIMRRTGSPCVEMGSVCEVGNWCDGQFCRAYLAVGTACSEDFSCGPMGACIDLACAVRGGASAPCTRDRHCLAGLACMSGVCTAVEQCE